MVLDKQPHENGRSGRLTVSGSGLLLLPLAALSSNNSSSAE
jgi:hypothetical protein